MEGSSKQASEAQLWAERQADPSVLSQLRRTFPVEVQSNSPLPAPADIPPFGGITTKGLQQMTDVGKQLVRSVLRQRRRPPHTGRLTHRAWCAAPPGG